jgi:hypothetical protein
MLRIVGVQRSERPGDEFVLLQNQGSLKASLRGHALISECGLDNGSLDSAAYVFRDETCIPPGLYVLLSSGCGEPHWAKTRDGQPVYRVYLGRAKPLWTNLTGPLHVLAPQHTFCERAEMLVVG